MKVNIPLADIQDNMADVPFYTEDIFNIARPKYQMNLGGLEELHPGGIFEYKKGEPFNRHGVRMNMIPHEFRRVRCEITSQVFRAIDGTELVEVEIDAEQCACS